jgi:hypothetical protein
MLFFKKCFTTLHSVELPAVTCFPLARVTESRFVRISFEGEKDEMLLGIIELRRVPEKNTVSDFFPIS